MPNLCYTMGLMAMSELTLSQGISRSDLLFPFARRRKGRHHGLPPRKPPPSTLSTPPQPPEEGFKFGRRIGLVAGGIGALGIAAGLLRPWEWITQPSHPEIGQYYPALGLEKLKEAGEIKTARTTTKWFNFSDMNFDAKVAEQTFQFFEDLAKKQPFLEYRLGNQLIPVSLGEGSRTQRLMFIIPDKVADPPWPGVGNDGSTTGYFEGIYAIFLRFHDSNATIRPSATFNTNTLAFGRIFATEAFQTSVNVASLSTQVAHEMREVIANSYGVSFTTKQLGTPYNIYARWATDVKFRLDQNSPEYAAYVLSAQEYTDIPVVGLPVK